MGEGKPVKLAGPRTAHLCEAVWSREVWLVLFGSFIHVEVDKTKTSMNVFPRITGVVKGFLHVPGFKEVVEAAVPAEVYEKAGS